MNKMIYSLFDNKGRVYLNPFYVRSTAEAKRLCLEVFLDRDKSPNTSRFCDDYDLMYLGEFDDVNGQFTNPDGFRGPEFVANLKQYKGLEDQNG